jgi:hypothetical protein
MKGDSLSLLGLAENSLNNLFPEQFNEEENKNMLGTTVR